ncbi:MAG: hypothetical protein F9K46_04750 [Anaerolineae bacterium]|nr:MAG: hypothetical protein F9K46_04750 [Anaerolineae bacterium]
MSISLRYEDPETFRLICKLCRKYHAYPGEDEDSKNFFYNLLSEYKGPLDRKSLTTYLDAEMAKAFIAYKKRPRWIQSGDWPFHNGKPMIFVGQIDIPGEVGGFHDDTSFYLFRPQGPFSDDECVVIVQQY